MADLLAFGGTGMLGRSVMRVGRRRGLDCVSAARRGADVDADISDAAACATLVRRLAPAVVVNCAAITDLDLCARDPAAADRVNGDAPGELAAIVHGIGSRFVQISTDHFFSGDGRAAHGEDAPVTLVNAYASSKFRGEQAVARTPGTLVLRTNITGWRGAAGGRPTFAQWAVGVLNAGVPATLFDDYFTSTIDTRNFAEAMLDAVELKASGLYNLASSEVSSKFEFVSALARRLSVTTGHLARGSVAALGVRRAESCGLDVSRAERMLGRCLPGLDDVVAALLAQRE